MQQLEKKSKTLQVGFTLVETMVAVTIFAIIILAPMTIAMKGLQNAFFANEQATATFLAQEAIEAVVQRRDSHALDVLYNGSIGDEVREWYDESELGPCHENPLTEQGCGYDPEATNPNNEFIDCSGSDPCRLQIRNVPGNGEEADYGYGSGASWTDSIYRRQVYIEEIPASSGNVRITVKVRWGTTLFTSGSRTITLQTWVMNQYDRLEHQP